MLCIFFKDFNEGIERESLCWRLRRVEREERRRGELQTPSFTNLTLCPSLPARKHRACKSFSCKGLGPASTGTGSRALPVSEKPRGQVCKGECWLFALSPIHSPPPPPPFCLSLSWGSRGSDRSQDFLTLCSQGDASLCQLSHEDICSSVRDSRSSGSLRGSSSLSRTPRE